jgi:hypothetical protein
MSLFFCYILKSSRALALAYSNSFGLTFKVPATLLAPALMAFIAAERDYPFLTD